MSKALQPVPQSVNEFEDRAMKEVTRLEQGHLSETKTSLTSVFLRRGNSETQERDTTDGACIQRKDHVRIQ